MRISEIIKQQRLDELHSIRQHTSQTFYSKYEVKSYLEEKGFTCVGIGNYTAVFDHPSFGGRYVLKVFADPFYEDFLGWCAANPNPHLPKVVGKVMKLGEVGRMVRLEKLKPMTMRRWDWTKIERFNDMLKRPDAYTDAQKHALAAGAVKKGLTGLFQTFEDVIAAAPAGAVMDVHDGNFMLRGDTVVITDPYGGAKIPFRG